MKENPNSKDDYANVYPWCALMRPVALVGLILTATSALAADRPDFSGSYTLRADKDSSKTKKSVSSTLVVVHGDLAIEITRTENGQENFNRFPLDGTVGAYTSPGGVRGTCSAQLKGKVLSLEALVTTRPQPTGPAVKIRFRERWELSADSKTLTLKIRADAVEFPDSPVGGFLETSSSEIYRRNPGK